MSLSTNDTGHVRAPFKPYRELASTLVKNLGISIPNQRICSGHSSQAEIFYDVFLERPPIALIHGSRGAGKSYLSALETHISSLRYHRLQTRILGGSQAQSKQIHEAMGEIAQRCSRDENRIRMLADDRAEYSNGSTVLIEAANATRTLYSNQAEVSILSASSKSVRGPHVQSLRLDEVDEIPEDIREAAMGMCMERNSIPGSVVMTSTWHRVNGSMATLIEQSRAGLFPLHVMCIFEVLERCPEERSGKNLEKCPECPLFRHCHGEMVNGIPKAKRSSGHYTIDSLIQKLRTTSLRTFESDYLCLEPRADGCWFTCFDPARHVGEDAEYDPALPVYVALDSGVFTGAVFFQILPSTGRPDGADTVRVFGDYLSENLTAERNAREIINLSISICNGRITRVATDPAGGARNPVGPTVLAEYERAGLGPLHRWPTGSVADGLALIESFMNPADGKTRLQVHPRCDKLIQALKYYRRAKRAGQWQDYPEDPQHPFEDLVDALRGGLQERYPGGRPKARGNSQHLVHHGKIF